MVSLLVPATAYAQKPQVPTVKPVLDSGQISAALFQGFLESVRMVWYVWLAVAIIVFGKLYLAYRRQARLAASGISEIDSMDGRTFEQYLETLFRRLGYSVELTPYAGDWGADLVLSQGGVKTAVQAKRHKKAVGVRAVQEAVAAKGKYDCSKAMVVTNSTYTKQAEELARANNVILWDRQRLVQALLSVKKEAASIPSCAEAASAAKSPGPVAATGGATVTASLYSEDLCCVCHKPVTAKVRDFCRANPSRFGDRIYCFDHQKQASPAYSERSTIS